MSIRLEGVAARAPRRSRLLGLTAVTAVIALGALGCTAGIADTAGSESLTDKAIGADGEAVQEIRLEGVEPLDSLEMAIPETDETNEAGENSDGETAALGETSKVERLHMTIGSDAKLTLNGSRVEGVHNYDNNPDWLCRDVASGRDSAFLDLPKIITSVAAGGLAESCFEDNRTSPLAELSYRLDDSEDLLWVYATVPIVGFNKVQCSILDRTTWKPSTTGKYSCSVAWLQQGDWLNPMPKIHVKREG